MKKMMISGVTALALLTGGIAGFGGVGSSVEAVQATTTFKDVPATHWASAAINSAVEQGYFKGYTDGTFKPSSPVTKAEMASILGRLSDQPNATTQEQNNFTDIPEWAKSGVSIAIAKGFINPSNYKGKLGAQGALQRGEMATWLTQGLTVVDPEYKQALSDVTNTVVPAKEYFTGKLASAQKNAVAVALGTGLMSVANDKTFGVDRTTTRAEVAVLIARYATVAKAKPADFQGLNELRAVGLTGTNLNIIAPKYQKTPERKIILSGNQKYDEVVTNDFSKVRNKEIVTDTNYADLKVLNWIIVDTNVASNNRSIYYPVFLDEGVKLQNDRYFSFVEFDLNIKSASMNQPQAGSLLNSATFNPLASPQSKSFLSYEAPKTGDYTLNRGVFGVKNPIYWARGMLHFNQSVTRAVILESKEGAIFSVIDTK
ncbi:S-layer homology domain-containing protein [Paenibacillus amylolyticus]|uniref:S-layer homology domain-containing protein n=1 Tax=Paenibacillus TaxID=44249 RepID=UPI00249C37F6|nr:S-layer homology domain-containing protein [Paenibacillus amylolyticus]WFA83889.1 S-layer homology domain-containing protein [Paenibacillus amylolyticus]